MRDRIREKRLRRAARDHELKLLRSWTLNRNEPKYGTYALVDTVRHTLVLTDENGGYGMSLDDVENFLVEITGSPIINGERE